MHSAVVVFAILSLTACSVLFEPGASNQGSDASDPSDARAPGDARVAADAGDTPLDAAADPCRSADDVFRYEVSDAVDTLSSLPAAAGGIEGRILEAVDDDPVATQLAVVPGPGKCSAALEFQGPRYVEVDHDEAWELGQGTLSFHYWASLDTGFRGIVSKDLSGNGEGHFTIYQRWIEESAKPYLVVRVQSASGSGYVCSEGYDPETWHEVTVTVDNGLWRVYLDGVQLQSAGNILESGHSGDCQMDGIVEGDLTQNPGSWIFGAAGEAREANGDVAGRFLYGGGRLAHIRLRDDVVPP